MLQLVRGKIKFTQQTVCVDMLLILEIINFSPLKKGNI